MSPFKTKEQRRAYSRKYYLVHKDQIREYYLARKEEKLEYDRKYRLAHREQLKEQGREYRLTHREERIEHDKQRRAQIIVTIDTYGNRIVLQAPNKRTKPTMCELCGRITKSLVYHHWDDNNPSMGLWLCPHCHIFAELFEKGFASRYLELKRRTYPLLEAKAEPRQLIHRLRSEEG